MLSSFGVLLPAVVTAVVAAAAFAVWMANRKRIAAETVGRAEEQALRIIKDAERDAETRKKEALLDAKEKGHEIVSESERQAHRARQEAQALEQTLARRESSLAEQQAIADRLEKRPPQARRTNRRGEREGWPRKSSRASTSVCSRSSNASSSAWRA